MKKYSSIFCDAKILILVPLESDATRVGLPLTPPPHSARWGSSSCASGPRLTGAKRRDSIATCRAAVQPIPPLRGPPMPLSAGSASNLFASLRSSFALWSPGLRRAVASPPSLAGATSHLLRMRVDGSGSAAVGLACSVCRRCFFGSIRCSVRPCGVGSACLLYPIDRGLRSLRHSHCTFNVRPLVWCVSFVPAFVFYFYCSRVC